MFSVYLQMFCIPQVENGTQRWAENQTDSEQGKRSRQSGASSVAVRQSPSDLNQKLRSLSSSLGRYRELRRDRGRWVGYVREAGGINGANLQERCRGSKRGQPPRRAERASRHRPETAQTLFARDSQRTDFWQRTVLPLVEYSSGEPGVLRGYLAIKSAGYTCVFSNEFLFYPVVNPTSAQCRPTTFFRQIRQNFVRFSININKCNT